RRISAVSVTRVGCGVTDLGGRAATRGVPVRAVELAGISLERLVAIDSSFTEALTVRGQLRVRKGRLLACKRLPRGARIPPPAGTERVFDGRLQIAELAAAVVALAAEAIGVDRLLAHERRDAVGELDLAAGARADALQMPEDRRGEHVAADDREVRGCDGGLGL